MSTKAGTATFLTSVGEEKLFNLQVPEGYEDSADSETHWELPWKEEPRVNKAFKRIAALGLEKHLLDLEVYGLTVITPGQINAALGLEDGEMLDRMLSAIMRIASEDSGVEHDQKPGTHSEGVATTPGTSPTTVWKRCRAVPTYPWVTAPFAIPTNRAEKSSPAHNISSCRFSTKRFRRENNRISGLGHGGKLSRPQLSRPESFGNV